MSCTTHDSHSRALSLNRRIVLANKCINGTRAGLEVFCAMLNLPSLVSQKPYIKVVQKEAILQVQERMSRA